LFRVIRINIEPNPGNADIVRLLLQQGADVNLKNDKVRNSTPLHWASSKGHLHIMKMLLEVVTAAARPPSPHQPTITNNNVFRQAPTSTKQQTIVALPFIGLRIGASQRQQPCSSTQVIIQPLFTIKTKTCLTHALSGADLHARDKKGKTALSYAVQQQQHDVSGVLRAHGAEKCAKCPRFESF
jgi:ankyrin repeat protein